MKGVPAFEGSGTETVVGIVAESGDSRSWPPRLSRIWAIGAAYIQGIMGGEA